jgi:hypothetical protein
MEGGDRMSRFREARHGRGAGDFPIRSRSSGGSASNDPLALIGRSRCRSCRGDADTCCGRPGLDRPDRRGFPIQGLNSRPCLLSGRLAATASFPSYSSPYSTAPGPAYPALGRRRTSATCLSTKGQLIWSFPVFWPEPCHPGPTSASTYQRHRKLGLPTADARLPGNNRHRRCARVVGRGRPNSRAHEHRPLNYSPSWARPGLLRRRRHHFEA